MLPKFQNHQSTASNSFPTTMSLTGTFWVLRGDVVKFEDFYALSQMKGKSKYANVVVVVCIILYANKNRRQVQTVCWT